MAITLSDLCCSLTKHVHTVEYYSDTRGGIDLSSSCMHQLFHAVRLIRPGYFRLAMDVNQFSLYCAIWNQEITLHGYLYQICNDFMTRAMKIGWLSKSRLDLEYTLSDLN